MENTSLKDEQYKLHWLLLHIRRTLRRIRTKELLQYGLTPEESAVLFIIQSIGRKATPAEISRWTLTASHSVSSLLMRMERKGLIKRVNDLDRKNLVRIAMTKKGQEAYSNSAKRESLHRVLSYLSDKELQQLRPLLEKLRDAALQEAGIDKKPPFPKFE